MKYFCASTDFVAAHESFIKLGYVRFELEGCVIRNAFMSQVSIVANLLGNFYSNKWIKMSMVHTLYNYEFIIFLIWKLNETHRLVL